MKAAIQLVDKLFRLALLLALGGGLVDATIEMRDKAIKAHSHGLISLRAINRQLVGQ